MWVGVAIKIPNCPKGQSGEKKQNKFIHLALTYFKELHIAYHFLDLELIYQVACFFTLAAND